MSRFTLLYFLLVLTYLRSRSSNRPLAGAQYPAGDHPERQHQNDEDCAGADRHQGLENKPRVELYPVQRADTARRRVGEQPAVKKKHAPDEVEAEEHRQRQQQVDGHLRGGDRLTVGVHRPPDEIVRAERRRMNHTDNNLDGDLEERATRDSDSPVIDAVVYHEQLKQKVHTRSIQLIVEFQNGACLRPSLIFQKCII